MDTIQLKQAAAEKAVEEIQSGMVIGLGVGSTAIFALKKIGELIQQGALVDILAIPCSLSIEEEAKKAGIPLTDFSQHSNIDLTIDGADEVDPELNLIKGGGGALMREKIVAQTSKREIIVVDQSKLSPQLGTHWPVPIEVTQFGWETQLSFLEDLGGKPKLRTTPENTPFTTDQGNFIIDCNFGPIPDLQALSHQLSNRVGILEHGLFLSLTTDLIVSKEEGIEHIRR